MHFTVMIVGEDLEKILAPYQENNMGDCPEEFLEDFDDGEGGTYKENPDAQWDWWILGGRWTGDLIELKKGATSGKNGRPSAIMGNVQPGTDQAKKKDIANLDKINTYAFLSDEWYSKDMFESEEEYFTALKEFKDSIGEDEIISIIDCHI